ncbi:MAG: CpsD/CapB family tyrosine-protein kinase [Actinomycetota bacterium]
MKQLISNSWPDTSPEVDRSRAREGGPPDFLQQTLERLEALQGLAETLDDTESARELIAQLDTAQVRLREVISGGLTTVEAPAPPCLPQVFHLHAAVERRLMELHHSTLDARQAIGAPRGRALGVTSAIRGEGKTTVALQLALHAAKSTHQTVCLAELGLTGDDLCFQLKISSQGEGIVSLLEETTRSLCRLRVEGFEELVILPAGKVPENAARVARSPRVSELLSVMREMFDLLIVDLPAMSTENALPLIRHLDGVVMVVRAGATPQKAVQRAVSQMEAEKVLGMVMNRGVCSIPEWLRKRLLEP